MKQNKKTKQRTCIACRKILPKDHLLRIVRSPEGTVYYDSTGRANGRGAYVCNIKCCNKAYKIKAFDRALSIKLTTKDYKKIIDDIITEINIAN